MYQAYLGVILGLFVIYTISQFLREKNVKDILLEVLKDIVTIGIGIIIYYLILKVILCIFQAMDQLTNLILLSLLELC